jgi:hypothetical protein
MFLIKDLEGNFYIVFLWFNLNWFQFRALLRRKKNLGLKNDVKLQFYKLECLMNAKNIAGNDFSL